MAIMTPEERAQLVQQVRTRSSDFNKRLHECGDVKVGAQLRIRMPSNYVKSDGPGLTVYNGYPQGDVLRVLDVQADWPTVYDAHFDERRLATQADIDAMERRIVQLNDERKQLQDERLRLEIERDSLRVQLIAIKQQPLSFHSHGETPSEAERFEIDRIWDAVKAASAR